MKAAQIAATALGVLAGLSGLEHGWFEIQQGNIPPASLVFASMGSPCVAATAWHACEPALTLLPNLLAAGLLALLLALLVLVWSLFFIQSKHGGSLLIALSIVMLLVGGGFFPPLIGLAGGAAGMQINKPRTGKQDGLARFAAGLWPWPLAILIFVLLAQIPLGYFFNDFLMSIMGYVLLLIVVFLPLSVYCAYAHDAA